MRYIPGRCLLRQLLREQRKAQKWLCKETGISQSNMSDYVRGEKKMSANTMKTVAMALGVPMDDLYDWIEIAIDDSE
ncbi:helix-turn-helix domain-containing protein [Paenibacillus sinopodophylli]|uniref:helix-turn-helix domain-containing protein n=1 Tax=Paenibacillus sinopodophylli TaxID=1837342 RepID=UPI00110CF48E|nr:helix-turn-helix transcriptional regulator [Paenibacillus sinopodophylli]